AASPAGGVVGRRAAARGDCPRRRQRATHPARRRAHREPRPAHLRARVRHTRAIGARLRSRRHHRYPQHGLGAAHGPARHLARRASGRDGIMNGRPSMRVLTAALIAAALAASSASAQMVDVSTITCKDFSAHKKDDMLAIMMWLAGYYTKDDDPTVIDFAKI